LLKNYSGRRDLMNPWAGAFFLTKPRQLVRRWFITLGAVLAASVLRAGIPVYRDQTATVEARVSDALARLTLDEKLTLLGGQLDGIAPIDRLGLPRIKTSDGPLGLRNDGKPSTAYPATIGLAASWNPELAREFGAAMGRDLRARGLHVLLGPAVNIIREPQGGRNFEYLSEDPTLAARLAAAIVNGVQSQGVVATVKHYAANNQETARNTVNVVVSERALREIYLPAFRAAVQDGHAWAVMDAYNRVNGSYCTGNDWLNHTVLKQEWGFQGVLMSDWSATYDTLQAANGGLDLEMPSGKYLNPEKIKPLIDSGRITMATIDDKVRRILRLEIANGFLDRAQLDSTIPKDDPRSAAIALKIARQAIVLLKNEEGVLPFDRDKIRSIIVLGDNALGYRAGGGSSLVQPFHFVSVLDGLRGVAGPQVEVAWLGLSAEALFQQVFPQTKFDAPLQLEVRNRWQEKTPLAQMPDTRIDRDWTGQTPARGLASPNEYFVRWTGRITPATTGRYLFAERVHGGSGISIDGRSILNVGDYDNEGPQTFVAAAELVAGHTYALEVKFFRRTQESYIHFGWGLAPPPLTEAERARVRAADAVVVCAGYDSQSQAEGADRPYELPLGQTELIQLAAGLNPRTVVVLNASGGVATSDWIGRVPALLNAWYPGQEGGRALAEILFGDVNPSGKLPISFEKRWEDCAAYGRFPFTQKDQVDYAEGVFVGYRWFDRQGIEPLFPFGFGLSYTKFKYDHLRVLPANDGGYEVTFDVTNTGGREGAEVAQVYVGAPPSRVPRPVRELKGFVRVALQSGQTQTRSVMLAREAFAYFDEQKESWTVEPGNYSISVGGSSRDLPLTALAGLL
jgi:beta-glucosidase